MAQREEDTLPVVQQENVLSLLCFDKPSAAVIVGAVDATMFGSTIYREIAQEAINFYVQYGDVIGDHLPDVFDHVLTGQDKRRAGLYDRVISALYATKDRLNSKYILSRLGQFVRTQNLKRAVTVAAENIQRNDIDQAESSILKALKYDLEEFDAGIFLKDTKNFLSFSEEEVEVFPTWVPVLDSMYGGPARGELHILLAPTNRGKSWWLVGLGKAALMSRYRVLHITLEMSAQRTSQRYCQALFSMTKRESEVRVPVLDRDESGAVIDVSYRELNNRPFLNDPKSKNYMSSKLAKMGNRLKLAVKWFPTSTLTISTLQTYLDRLEMLNKFIPDLILIDYPDLMKVDADNLRLELGQIYKDLRRIAGERNCAVAVVSQSNRAGEDARYVTLKHLGEDYSKAQTADVIISYNRTEAERQLNLARLFIAKHRNEEAGGTILISQAYAIGQFCMDSAQVALPNYWAIVDSRTGGRGGED